MIRAKVTELYILRALPNLLLESFIGSLCGILHGITLFSYFFEEL